MHKHVLFSPVAQARWEPGLIEVPFIPVALVTGLVVLAGLVWVAKTWLTPKEEDLAKMHERQRRQDKDAQG